MPGEPWAFAAGWVILGIVEVPAAARAERIVAGAVAVILAGHVVVELVSLPVERAHQRLPLVDAVAVVVGVAVTLRLAAASRRPGQVAEGQVVGGPVELVLGWAAVVAGAAVEAGLTSPTVAASSADIGFTSLALAVFAASARLAGRPAATIVTAACAVHACSLRSSPPTAAAGVVLLVMDAVATALAARWLREAAVDADSAAIAAREAEREQSAGRVHDTLALLRVLARDQLPAHQVPEVFEQAGSEVSDDAADLPSRLRALPREFPDLPLLVDVDDLRADVPRPVADAVVQALHPLLANVREHAAAHEVLLHAWGTSGGWGLVLADDGVGFDSRRTPPGRGLSRFSVDVLAPAGVRMTVQAAPGHGTQVVLEARAEGHEAERRSVRSRWRKPRATGLRRSRWLVDVTSGALLATAWLFLAAAGPGAGAPRALLAAVGAAALTAAWWSEPLPARRWALPAAVVAVAAAVAVTALGGPAGTQDKLGVALAAFACMFLAAREPRLRWWATALALPQGVPAAREGLVVAVLGVLWAVVGVQVAALLAQAFLRFGAEADADRDRAAALARRDGDVVQERQLAALRLAAAQRQDRHARSELARAMVESENYLRRRGEPAELAEAVGRAVAALHLPLPAAALDLRLDDDVLMAAPEQPAVVSVVCDLVALVARQGADAVSVRAARLPRGIEVTALCGGLPPGFEVDAVRGRRARARALGEGLVLVTVDLQTP